VDQTSYQARREQLLDLLGEGVIIIAGARHQTRSHDTEYPFRQSSAFRYLTGLHEPEAMLILSRGEKGDRSIVFTRPKDALAEQWSGIRLGPEKSRELSECTEGHSIEKYAELLPDFLKGHRQIAVDWENLSLVQQTITAVQGLARFRKQKFHRPAKLIDARNLIGRLRLVKEPNELLSIKKATEISSRAHRVAMAFASPGKNESEVEAILEYAFKKQGARHPAYESIVAGGENALILHYIANNKALKDGDLLLIDAGAEFNEYASDITRTFPINGRFSPAQKDVYQIVYEAQRSSLSRASAGHTIPQVHEAASRILAQGLIDLKIAQGSVDSVIEDGTLKKYYPHGTSHWMGLDVHDECPYLEHDLADIAFAPGMIFTVEPGLYLPHGDPKVSQELAGIGIRIEDDVLITASGHDNLTVATPKSIGEIEEACAKDWQQVLS
jgi:Xaa-Pro aminopeptidase